MDKSDHDVQVDTIDAENVVVFGMVEARPAVNARRVIVDPQYSLTLGQVVEAVVADDLVIVANHHEVIGMASIPNLNAAAQTIIEQTGATGLVVKAGALGALVFRPNAEVVGVPAIKTERVFPIGSGDVFTAALAKQYLEGQDLVTAARQASLRTAGYVTTRQLGPVEMPPDVAETASPTVHSVQNPPTVYVAASFANAEQRWSASTIADGIRDIGGRSLYPLRDLGQKQEAVSTAQADLRGLDSCNALVLLADVARTGPFFEAGWATCRGLPTVVVNSDSDPDRYTMLRGTGAESVSDLSTAAYRSVWAAVEHQKVAPDAVRLMLLSGGIDSAAVAAVERPEHTLFIDYGQASAEAERTAARAVANYLGLELTELSVNFSALGCGLITGSPQIPNAPSPEWFPFRNQFLVTIAAAHAVKNNQHAVVVGLVAGDGRRHADGTPEFIFNLDSLLRSQEMQIRILAPQINTPPSDLLNKSGLPQELVHLTHSCHVSNNPCQVCPGCRRREELLRVTFSTQ
jgi:7-cyano-7-deazaguanine synthase